MPRPSHPISPLFRLPLEIRQRIYSLLLPAHATCYPLPSVRIPSVSHALPTPALLSIHPRLTDEILDHFYAITTWKLIFGHSFNFFNFFRTDFRLERLEASSILRRLRKVEILFFCDVVLGCKRPSFGAGSFCPEIAVRAARAVDVLLRADELRVLTVSWMDMTGTGDWAEKRRIFDPLQRLADRCTFKIGTVNPPADRPHFIAAMEGALDVDATAKLKLECDSTVLSQEPAELRMWLFEDVRQERQLADAETVWFNRGARRSSGVNAGDGRDPRILMARIIEGFGSLPTATHTHRQRKEHEEIKTAPEE